MLGLRAPVPPASDRDLGTEDRMSFPRVTPTLKRRVQCIFVTLWGEDPWVSPDFATCTFCSRG